MNNTTPVALLLCLGLASGAVAAATPDKAAAPGYVVSFEDETQQCLSTSFTPHIGKQELASKSGQQYQADPSAWQLIWVKWGGLFGTTSFIPATEMESLHFTGMHSVNAGVRQYEVRLRSGEVLKVDDNFPPLHVCPPGATKFSQCVIAYHIELSCIVPKEGVMEARSLSFDRNRNDATPPAAKSGKLKAITLAAPAQMEEALAAHRQAAAERPARLAAIETARRNDQARDNARVQEFAARQQADTVAALRDAQVGAKLYCDSGRSLLPPGGRINGIDYECGLPQNVSLGMAERYGWEIASEARMPEHTSWGDMAYRVSLTLRKARSTQPKKESRKR